MAHKMSEPHYLCPTEAGADANIDCEDIDITIHVSTNP